MIGTAALEALAAAADRFGIGRWNSPPGHVQIRGITDADAVARRSPAPDPAALGDP